MTRVCITGSAGFIGSHVSEVLASEHDVVGIDNLTTGRQRNLKNISCQLIVDSILNESALSRAVRGSEVVVHLAAIPSVSRSIENPWTTHEVNTNGTMRVLQAAREANVQYVIVASSSSVYGSNALNPKNESMLPQPMSPYAVSKLASEQYAMAWSASFGLPTLALRFFNVFGPRQSFDSLYAAAIPRFINAALTGIEATIFGDGEQTRDFTSVKYVAQTIKHLIITRPRPTTPVNLAVGHAQSVNSVLHKIEELTGRTINRKYHPARLGEVLHSSADVKLVRQLVPVVTPIPFETGLKETIEWLARQIGEEA